MGLSLYRKKRAFNRTPEPQSGKSRGRQLRFVVQKHQASRLHYDFRLEMDGVLKSWAVPKGPSLNPADRRLAMMVEDHPYDYKDFEGVIPEGNYGAGTVIVWDAGTYAPIDDSKGKAAQERSLLKQLSEGSVKVLLKGKKLKGEFALVKTKGMGENAWLLIKHKDQYASDTDITLRDKSVISNKAIEKVALKPGKVYKSPRQTASRSPVKKTKSAAKKSKEENGDEGGSVATILKKAPAAPFPKTLSPMLATLVDASFDDEDWEYEVKWDGYRTLTFKKAGSTTLLSRNGKRFNEKFYPVFDALQEWDTEAVIDGEIVGVDSKGISRFNKLQNWRSEADGQLLYYVFDVLWYKGKILTGLPLSERMQVLKAIIPAGNELIRMGFSIVGRGLEFFATAQKMGLEGIIAKRLGSTYLPGIRTRDWLKIKAQQRQEVIIVGYTHNEGSPKLFSSLLLGVYNKGRLCYAGKVGTGFNDKMQRNIMQRIKPLIVKRSLLQEIPDYNKPSRFRPHPPHADAIWVKPGLICEISFTEVTEDGVFRHPSFKGMREDKAAAEVVREQEQPVEKLTKQENDPGKGNTIPAGTQKTGSRKAVAKRAMVAPAAQKKRSILLNPTEKTQTRRINGRDLQFTNLDKMFWREDKITKRDLLNYYYQVASYILPFIKDRPQSLYRFPDGYKGKSFYQKDVTGKVPPWAATYLYHTEGDKEDKHFLVAKDEASLLFMVNFGCIEINPWSSTIRKPDYPDWCLLDLDPGSKTTFNKVVDAALVIHDLLESIDVPSFPKTSGSTGIHIYIPLGKKYTYKQSKEFARVIVTAVHAETGSFTSIERTVNEREGKLYLDFLQNRPQATLAAPYSVRPKPKATVSMPLHWEEVKHGLKMQDFTLKNVPSLLEERGGIFKPVLGRGIDMIAALKRLQQL
jgi:bifunctional non-homologous end joining protein LigD